MFYSTTSTIAETAGVACSWVESTWQEEAERVTAQQVSPTC